MGIQRKPTKSAFIETWDFLTKLCICHHLDLENPLSPLWIIYLFPAFYGTWRFITTFTSACHLPLSWASWIQSIPLHPTSWRFILILSSHLCLGLPSGLFPSGFPTKTLHIPLLSPIHATCPANLILLDFITWTILGEAYRSFSSLCSFQKRPDTKFLFIS